MISAGKKPSAIALVGDGGFSAFPKSLTLLGDEDDADDDGE